MGFQGPGGAQEPCCEERLPPGRGADVRDALPWLRVQQEDNGRRGLVLDDAAAVADEGQHALEAAGDPEGVLREERGRRHGHAQAAGGETGEGNRGGISSCFHERQQVDQARAFSPLFVGELSGLWSQSGNALKRPQRLRFGGGVPRGEANLWAPRSIPGAQLS